MTASSLPSATNKVNTALISLSRCGRELDKIVNKIAADMPKIAIMRDGLMHFQLLRFCESTRFAHVVRALPPAWVARAASTVDQIIMDAFTEYNGWPLVPDVQHHEKYITAQRIVRGALREGGFGLTAVADTALPAFYHAASHSLRWICSQDSIMHILQWDLSGKPEELPGSFVQYFLGAERELLEHGCARPNDSSIRPSGATALLPVWTDLITPRADNSFFPLPPQRVVVRTYLTIKRSLTAVHNASHYPFMCNRQLQIIKDHHLSPLKDLLGFSQEQLRTASISYNPMAFLMAIPVTKWQLFPKHLFQHWVRLALDLPFDDCERTCEACGKQQDDTGHHRATCASRATKAWKRGHSHVVEALGNMLGIAAIGSTTKDGQIPRHVDSDRHGDILVDCKVAPFSDLVLDFTLTHPRTGSSNKYPIGSWKPDALGTANNKKIKKHALSYEQAQHAFLSLTADTYGKISDDFVRFLWMMANAASTNFRLSQPSPNSEPSLSQDTFTKLRGSLFSRFRVQIAAAIAKAAAARFVPDSTNDGIPTFVVWDRGRKPLTNSAPEDDLPLYHIPCT